MKKLLLTLFILATPAVASDRVLPGHMGATLVGTPSAAVLDFTQFFKAIHTLNSLKLADSDMPATYPPADPPCATHFNVTCKNAAVNAHIMATLAAKQAWKAANNGAVDDAKKALGEGTPGGYYVWGCTTQSCIDDYTQDANLSAYFLKHGDLLDYAADFADAIAAADAAYLAAVALCCVPE